MTATYSSSQRFRDLPIGIDTTGKRCESDSMGEIEVPADRDWGAQTQRSLIHCSIGEDRMPKAVYHAYGTIKKASAMLHKRAGRLGRRIADAIIHACDETIAGDLDDSYPLYVFQTGSGTQSNMNEGVSNRAIQSSSCLLRSRVRRSCRARSTRPSARRW